VEFMVQGKINRSRHTDHPAGRHSIWTKQCPPPSLGFPKLKLNASESKNPLDFGFAINCANPTTFGFELGHIPK